MAMAMPGSTWGTSLKRRGSSGKARTKPLSRRIDIDKWRFGNYPFFLSQAFPTITLCTLFGTMIPEHEDMDSRPGPALLAATKNS